MLSLNSTISRESKAHPGVRFTVRRLNHLQRAKRTFGVLQHASRIQELLVEYRQVLEAAGIRARPFEEEQAETERRQAANNLPRAAALDSEIGQLLDAHIKPAAIQAGLLSIDGFHVDGKAATPEQVLEFAPPDLLEEIFLACETASGLNGEEQKNSQSPGLSPGPEAGNSKPTTARSANGSAPTADEIANAISLS